MNSKKKNAKRTATEKNQQREERTERHVRLQHLAVMLMDAWSLYDDNVDPPGIEYALMRLHDEEGAYRGEFTPLTSDETNALELIRYFATAALDDGCFGDYVHAAYEYAEDAVMGILQSESAHACRHCGDAHGSHERLH